MWGALRRLWDMALAYFSGVSAGKAQAHLAELKADDATERAIVKAAVGAPSDPDSVAAELRRGTF